MKERTHQLFVTTLMLVALLSVFMLNSYSPLMAAVKLSSDKMPRPMSLEQMTTQYAELRSKKGHFDGQPWNRDVDLWSGKKHLLMRALSNWLETEMADREQVIEIMGNPDSIVTSGTPDFSELPDAVKRGEVLIYFWRNRHDYLYFSCNDAAPCRSAWWHAYE